MGWDWLKELVAKAITVGATAVIYEGTDILMVVLSGQATPLEYKALALVFGYAVWTKIIVPRMEEFFTGERSTAFGEHKSAFELI